MIPAAPSAIPATDRRAAVSLEPPPWFPFTVANGAGHDAAAAAVASELARLFEHRAAGNAHEHAGQPHREQ